MSRILLKQSICDDLRKSINETNLFIKDNEYNKKFNFICTIMDRFDTCVSYINEHQELPESEFEFISFLSACCIIFDGINLIYDNFNQKMPQTKRFFKHICNDYPIDLDVKDYKGDDKFFKYFRAMVFAHPFNTERIINKKPNETQYCPYVLINKYSMKYECETVGIMIYNNLSTDTNFIEIPFSSLKKFIQYKYKLLEKIVILIKDIIKDKENIWMQHKVNRVGNTLDILVDIKNILNERYIDVYDIEDLIEYYSCNSSIEKNKKSLEKYRNEIDSLIPLICDACDDYNHEELFRLINSIISVRLKSKYQMMNYQLEKIYGYLNNDYDIDSSSVKWGLKQAEEFANNFAKKWVIIKPYKMNFTEIKALTNVACYLEYKEQSFEEE